MNAANDSASSRRAHAGWMGRVEHGDRTEDTGMARPARTRARTRTRTRHGTARHGTARHGTDAPLTRPSVPRVFNVSPRATAGIDRGPWNKHGSCQMRGQFQEHYSSQLDSGHVPARLCGQLDSGHILRGRAPRWRTTWVSDRLRWPARLSRTTRRSWSSATPTATPSLEDWGASPTHTSLKGRRELPCWR